MTEEVKYTGAVRRVTIGSPTKQSSNKRITFPLTMTLTGELLGDLPDWVSTGFDAVTDSFTEVDPEVQQVADVLLAFTNDKPGGKLFKTPDAKIPNAELRNFKIKRAGDPDDPEVQLEFKAFAPYSRDFWAWIGEMAGEEVFMNFPTALAKSPERPAVVTGDLGLSTGDEAASAKSGPKNLVAKDAKAK